jgi:hypothetical protein
MLSDEVTIHRGAVLTSLSTCVHTYRSHHRPCTLLDSHTHISSAEMVAVGWFLAYAVGRGEGKLEVTLCSRRQVLAAPLLNSSRFKLYIHPDIYLMC